MCIPRFRLWERTSPGVKVIISRDVIFNEDIFPCKTTNHDAGTFSINPMSQEPNAGTQIEVEPSSIQPDEETEMAALDHDQEGEPAEILEPTQEESLAQYQLTRDRTRRETRPPARYSYADLIFTALVAGVEVLRSEPDSYEGAIRSKDKDKWQATMEEEMQSLKVNRTWSLVPTPKDQKLVEC